VLQSRVLVSAAIALAVIGSTPEFATAAASTHKATAVAGSTRKTDVVNPDPTQTAEVLVPRHTAVYVLLTKDVRVGGWGAAIEQKKLKFELLQDVVVDGYTIAEKGDLVEGHFTTERNLTRRVFSFNSSQELALDVDDLVNFCGDTVHLNFERTFVGGARGYFFGVHAHDAVFAKGLKLKVETDRLEKSVCGAKTDFEAPAAPTDVLLSDDEDPKSSNPSINATVQP